MGYCVVLQSRICYSLGYTTVWEESGLGYVLSGIRYSLVYVTIRVVSHLVYVTVWVVTVWVKDSLVSYQFWGKGILN